MDQSIGSDRRAAQQIARETGASRLALLLVSDGQGGVWRGSLELAAALGDQNVDVHFAIPAPTSAEQRAAIARAGARGAAWDGRPESLPRLARALDADLVHLPSPALAAGVELPVPVIATLHGCPAVRWASLGDGPPPAHVAEEATRIRAGIERLDLLVTPTAAFAAAAARIHGLAAAPAAVHHGRAWRESPSAAPHDFAFASSLVWDETRDLATLERAAARLAVPFYAAGRIDEEAAARLEHVHPLGLLDHEELDRRLGARPVFISAARYEPFGMTVLEAAMAGCPLILSDIPTYRELWDGVASFAAPGDDAAFARAIGELVGDDFARAARGRAARERATRYTSNATASRMAALYRRLATARPMPDPEPGPELDNIAA